MRNGMQAGLAQQLALHGADALLDEELAALALGASVGRARSWLNEHAHPVDKRGDPRWRALVALTRRIEARPMRIPVIASAKDAAALLGPRLLSAEVEELHVLALDSRNRVLAAVQVARGGASQVAVTARDVFHPLIRASATRAIVAHNHPSGDPAPSEADRELTVRLAVAGDLLGVVLLDHLVLAQDGYFSFAEVGAGMPLSKQRRRR